MPVIVNNTEYSIIVDKIIVNTIKITANIEVRMLIIKDIVANDFILFFPFFL